MITPNTGHVMTVANSIIGVGILAMPFCFQKCGIVLSIVLLLANNLVTRISCHYLIKSSLLTRRKSFEFLAFHAFGFSGKLMVELCMIGYLIGTCIAYFVVVGDLGPQIAAKVLNVKENDNLRTWVMIAVTLLCIVPLGMLKNVDSLAAVCTASIGFYMCLVVKVMAESKAHIVAHDWMQHIEYWKPSGTLQCVPIFSMALSCQMQLFEVFETVSNASLEKMNKIVKAATMICMCVYIFVGIFGYIAFCNQHFGGNILVNFSPSLASDAIKMGFVLSVAFSFPLVIFPCRASIYSLLYRRGHADTTGYIPELRFKTITVSIVLFSLCVALLIPSIELVIGLVGSTIGVVICIMFPASCFMKVCKKECTEKRLAQFILIGGFCLMILGTYANLNAIDEKRSGSAQFVAEAKVIEKPTSLENLSDGLKATEQHQAEAPIEIHLPKSSTEEKLFAPVPKKIDDNNNNENVNPVKVVISNINKKDEQISKPDLKPQSIENKEMTLPLIQNNADISKDAIKKEDEVVAEESPKRSNQQIPNAEVELQKAKELLEKKVDELQKQLKQQNEETKNLVVEKLGDIVEEVEKIEREVHKDVKKPEKQKDKQLDNETVKKFPEEDQRKSKPEETLPVGDNKKSKKLEEKLTPPLPKASLVNMLTENLKEQQRKKQTEPNNSVFEPLSYKTGEIINNLEKAILNETKSALPLPLLLNASLPKQQISEIKDNLVKTAGSVKPIKKEPPEENNIESIRRDILQANTNSENDPATAALENYKREKRNAERDACVNWDTQIEDCLDKKSIDSMLPKSIANLEIESIGRDLKSIKEKT